MITQEDYTLVFIRGVFRELLTQLASKLKKAMLQSVKKGVYQTMNRQLNNFQRKLMLDQLDVSKGDGNERPVLDALAAYKREKETVKDAPLLTAVQARVAQANAYKEFVEEMLGPQQPGKRRQNLDKVSYLKLQEMRRKQKNKSQAFAPDEYIKAIDLNPQQALPKALKATTEKVGSKSSLGSKPNIFTLEQ